MTFTNKLSKPPINAPTIMDITITTTVSFIVSSRVGQVTFLSSAITSLIKATGVTISYIISYQAAFAQESFVELNKTPSQGL